jgi:hypothetical protein
MDRGDDITLDASFHPSLSLGEAEVISVLAKQLCTVTNTVTADPPCTRTGRCRELNTIFPPTECRHFVIGRCELLTRIRWVADGFRCSGLPLACCLLGDLCPS